VSGAAAATRGRLGVTIGRLPGAPRGPRRGRLVAALEEAARLAGARGSLLVDVVWSGDRTMRALNRKHAGRGETTDVLAFADGADDPEHGGRRLGEVVCNLDEARRSARTHRNTYEAEAVLYAAHGLVHLLGGDDDTPRGRRAMRRVERGALAAAGMSVRGGEWDEV
jgi:probable rRNA maturation factor